METVYLTVSTLYVKTIERECLNRLFACRFQFSNCIEEHFPCMHDRIFRKKFI